MTKKRKKKKQESFDHSIKLSDEERGILKRAVKKVVRSIAKRTRDPIERRLLVMKVPREADFRTTMELLYVQCDDNEKK